MKQERHAAPDTHATKLNTTGPVIDHECFIDRLKTAGFSKEDILLIDYAYDIAKYAHHGIEHQTGKRHFEYVRSVALILITECLITDKDLIIAALLHDSVKDTWIFGNPEGYERGDSEISNWRLRQTFNRNTQNYIEALTKIDKDSYLEQIERAPIGAIIVKMADRLHDLRTLKNCPVEKQIGKIKETQDEYLPIFRDLAAGDLDLDVAAGYLLGEIEEEVGKLTLALGLPITQA